MARGSALAGSLAVHGVIALLIVLLLTEQRPAERNGAPPGGTPIEIVHATPQPTEPPGGSPRPHAAAPVRAPRQARLAAPRSEGTPMFAAETTVRMEEPSAAGGGPGGHGEGGQGGGRGAGIGLGDGNGISNPADVAAIPLPLPRRISLARPPQLIWPTRQGPLVESELYIARLKIDADGLVDGVRLVRRFREPRDDQAEDAVWKFRYLPALDDDGHPTTATIEQPFLLRIQ